MRIHTPVAGLAALALLIVPTGAVEGATGEATAAAVSATPARADRITLITGDRVEVTRRPGRSDRVRLLPGSPSRALATSYHDGHTYAVPVTAAAEVARGRLDRALFDVTTLLRERREDSRSTVIPVIIEYDGAARAVRRTASIAGLTATRALGSLGAEAGLLRKTAAGDFWRSLRTPAILSGPRVKRVWLDRTVRAVLDESVPQIGAPAAWRRGVTGKGVTVAVLDTGIDGRHPDLAGRVAAAKNFSESADTVDRVGHGTHVAGTIVGSGKASGGKYRGVAPGTRLLNGKILDDDGYGTMSGVIAGMEWAAKAGAKVVNVSISTETAGTGTDPVERALNTLSRRTGALFVVAAGNCMFDRQKLVGSPGAAELALTVANLNHDGTVNTTSCHGPRQGDRGLKPEIGAPGTGIVSARAAGAMEGEPVGRYYSRMSGTSMATPHVAGVAALLAQRQPRWNGQQLKARLVSTADPQSGGTVDLTGAGRVDADQATDAGTLTGPAKLNFGSRLWPHPKPAAVLRTVTYLNPGAKPVTLRLATRMVAGDNGRPPVVSATRLVVPAHGKKSVTVTAVPGAGAVGRHTGTVTAVPATGGDPLVTVFGWFLEPEMYNLTVRGIQWDGGPADGLLTIGRASGDQELDLGPEGPALVDGVGTYRVPPGTYSVSTALLQLADDRNPDTVSVLAEPDVEVRRNTTVTLDARQATTPVGASIRGRPGLGAVWRTFYLKRTDPTGKVVAEDNLEALGEPLRLLAKPSGHSTVGRTEFSAGARLEIPPYTATVAGAPLPVTEVPEGVRLNGRLRLTVADAGTARPQDLREVRGKLAVVRMDVNVLLGDQALAVQRAGAAAVLFYDPDTPGLQLTAPILEPAGATLPVLRTGRADAARLLQAAAERPVRLLVTGVATSPVVYDLVTPYAGGVPDRAWHTAGQDEFAQVDETFGLHRPGVPLQDVRTGVTPLGAEHGRAGTSPIIGPFRRTSYVLANSTRWAQTVVAGSNEDLAAYLTLNQTARRYQPGEQDRISWLTPVATSGIPAGAGPVAGVRRSGGALVAGLIGFGRGPDQYEDPEQNDTGTFALTAYRNGALLGRAAGQRASFKAPAGPASYRIDLDARRSISTWAYSTRVRSSWEFRATGGPAETMPLILADLDVPQASPLNQVPAGAPALVRLGLRHQPGAATPRFTSVRVEQSYDRKTWTEVPVLPAGGARYLALPDHPGSAAGRVVHLRLDVRDADGGRLIQLIDRAYSVSAR